MRLQSFFILLFFVTATHAQEVDVLHYRFAIELNDENDTVSGNAAIRLINKTGGPLQLDLVQTGENGKGMKVMRVERDDEKAEHPFSQQNNKIILPILKGRPGDTLLFHVTYKGVPEDGLIISKNKFGERTFFADNWPNRAHHWLPCVDRPDDKASFAFTVTAPSHYRIISNGVKTEEKNAGTRTVTTWQQDTPLSTKVMVIGAARFAVKTFADSPENLPISAWVYPQDSTKGFYDYALAPQIVKFLAGYIAPFPFTKLANVQSTTIFGGMENASCIFYAENSVTGDRRSESTVAHEIAHQWFGDMASEKSFAHLWLSEGFATYLTHLYFEQTYGKDVLRKRLCEDRETVIQFAETESRPVVDSTENLMSLLNANSYQKGGWVLHMLRNEVGDSVFQQIVQMYYNQFKGSNAETRHLQTVAEKVSGKELKWFFDQWLYQPAIPELEVWWNPGKKEIRVVQTQKQAFQFPLDVSFITPTKERVILTLNVNQKDQTFQVSGTPSEGPLFLDPDTKLLFTGSTVTESTPKLRKK